MGQSKTTIIITRPLSPSHHYPASTPSTPLEQLLLQHYTPVAPPSHASIFTGSYITPLPSPPTPPHRRSHSTMGDQQYIAHSLQQPEGLSGNSSLPEVSRSSAAPPASAYSTILTPYSAVSLPSIHKRGRRRLSSSPLLFPNALLTYMPSRLAGHLLQLPCPVRLKPPHSHLLCRLSPSAPGPEAWAPVLNSPLHPSPGTNPS